MTTDTEQPKINVFAPTEQTRKKMRRQRLVGIGFGVTTVLILIPLVCLVGFLFIKAWPSLTWDFITDVPKNGMRSGGIWPALIGTLYLVVFSLLGSVSAVRSTV